MIKSFVRGQSLQIAQPLVVTGTRNYIEMSVNFKTEDWNGLSKWVHFRQDGGEELPPVALNEQDMISRDSELDLTTGDWIVWIHGTSPSPDGLEITRITTDEKIIHVKNTGMEGDHPLPGIGCDVAEQLDAKIQNAVNLANEASLKANEALQAVLDVEGWSNAAEAAMNAAKEAARLAKISEENAKFAANKADLRASSALASQEAAKTSEINSAEHKRLAEMYSKTARGAADSSYRSAIEAEGFAKKAEDAVSNINDYSEFLEWN